MKIFLYFLVPIGLFLIAWFIGGAPVSSPHAWAFLMHQDGPLIIILGILEIIVTVIAVFGTAFQWFFVVTQKWVWALAVILAFILPAALAYTRNAASDDPNISARYDQFAAEKGWK